MPTSITTQCPNIDTRIISSEFNKPVEYECPDGTMYVYYSHFDGFDQTYNCQFCKKIGRKRDVFECLNESEWRQCPHAPKPEPPKGDN
jgi:hypothetical protein